MKKNVCMIAHTRYSWDARVRREAETLAADGNFDVTVLALAEGSSPRRYILDNVTIQELNAKKYRGSSPVVYVLSYFQFLFIAFLHCTWLFLRKRIDIVHIHNMPNFLVFSATVPRFFGKKLILDMHDSFPEMFAAKFKKPSNFLFKVLCVEELISSRLAHHIICVNHVQRDILVSRGFDYNKISISMNLPDPKRFNRSIFTKFEKNSSVFKMAYHGTINQRLGIELAIQAVYILKDKIPNFEFHIWGEGEDMDNCIQLAKRLRVFDIVFFHGSIPLDSVEQKLKEIYVGIVPNRRNIATDLMLPVKLLEYIWLGIPVIAPRLKGIEYYFSDQMISYFEPGDVQSMVTAIMNLYINSSLRISQSQKAEMFLKKYNWDTHKASLLNIYSKSI